MSGPDTRPLGDNWPASTIETASGASTSARVDIDQSHGKRINDWGPWVTIVGIIASSSLAACIGLFVALLIVNDQLRDYKAEQRTDENKQTSEMWRIDNHLRDLEIAMGKAGIKTQPLDREGKDHDRR